MESKINILYCEDEVLIRELTFAKIINTFPNSNITVCSDGVEGQKKILESDFQLVISDFHMGVENGDGISLYKAFRARNEKNLFVIFSGHPQSHFEELLRDKRFMYISKGKLMSDAICMKIKKCLRPHSRET